jgi:subtilisin family serine protease
MKKVFTIALLFAVQLFSNAQETNIVPGQVMVMLHHRESAAEFMERINALYPGLDLSSEQILSSDINIHLFRFNDSNYTSVEALNAVIRDKATAIAQFNHTNVTLRDTCPTDPNFGSQWAFYNNGTNGGSGTSDIQACDAWSISRGGFTAQNDRIVVAVIDGGFDLNHVDISYYTNSGEIAGNGIDDDNNGYIDDIRGWNAINNTANAHSTTSATHATHVSGTVGAKGGNNIGVTGVNWDVDILPIRGSSGNESVVVTAYSYVLKMRRTYNQTNGAQGAFVVSTNSSFGVDLGNPANYPIWCAMYDSLGKEGVLSATATANANYNIDTQGDIPTACPSDWMIAVTNTRSDDSKATAGYGATTIDLGAPGTNIYSTTPNNNYGNSSGTSMATPHVAGTIALMWSAACSQMISDYKDDPEALALIMKYMLLNDGVDSVFSLQNITVTGGRLNLYKALLAVLEYTCNVGVDETIASRLMIFPNPGNDLVSIVLPESAQTGGQLEVYSVTGQLVYTSSVAAGTPMIQISISDFSSGFYSIILRTSESTPIFGTIIRQ